MTTSTPPSSAQIPGAGQPDPHAMSIIRGIVEAERVTSPHGLAAQTLKKIFGANDESCGGFLTDAADAINGGSLVAVEGTLSSQAVALNALFHRLTQFSFEGPRSSVEFAAYMKLALRAQAQSAQALETLATLKQGPRVVVTGQLNAAHQQVINNGSEAMKPAEGRKPNPKMNSRKGRSEFLPISNPLPNTSPQTQPLRQHAPLDG